MTESTQEVPRKQLLTSAALALLEEHGPAAMTTRKVAAQVGTSSMSVYTDFGSLGDLVASVVQVGFDRFGAALKTVEATADPVADLWRLGLAYRDFALTNRHLYSVMFAAEAPGGYRRSGLELMQGFETFEIHVECSRRALESRRLATGDAFETALTLWAAMHGMVMLEMAGFLDVLPDPVSMMLRPGFITSMVGLGDDPVAAAASAAS